MRHLIQSLAFLIVLLASNTGSAQTVHNGKWMCFDDGSFLCLDLQDDTMGIYATKGYELDSRTFYAGYSIDTVSDYRGGKAYRTTNGSHTSWYVYRYDSSSGFPALLWTKHASDSTNGCVTHFVSQSVYPQLNSMKKMDDITEEDFNALIEQCRTRLPKTCYQESYEKEGFFRWVLFTQGYDPRFKFEDLKKQLKRLKRSKETRASYKFFFLLD